MLDYWWLKYSHENIILFVDHWKYLRHSHLDICFFNIFNIYIYWFKRERNIDWLSLVCTPRGDWTRNLGICPDQGSNLQLFDVLNEASTNWATWPGPDTCFKLLLTPQLKILYVLSRNTITAKSLFVTDRMRHYVLLLRTYLHFFNLCFKRTVIWRLTTSSKYNLNNL